MIDLLKISIDNSWGIAVQVSPWLYGIGAVISILIVGRLFYLNGFRTSFEIDKTEIGIGTGKVTIKPSYEDLQIAFQLWAELNTRKIALPLDEEHDVFAEVYDSWYEFFRIARELIKSVPVTRYRRYKSTRTLVDTALAVLNAGLRPHLTKWQAKYRRWYRAQLEQEENRNLSPQEIQRRYPNYADLVTDMKRVNRYLLAYSKILGKMVVQ
mgnify:CR=1 FL=1